MELCCAPVAINVGDTINLVFLSNDYGQTSGNNNGCSWTLITDPPQAQQLVQSLTQQSTPK